MTKSIPNILIVIPARGGSKGVPNKNLRLLAGKPLIHYAIQTCCSLQYNARVIVSTDSEKIAEAAKICGAEVPFLRPRELATDSISIIPVIQHAYEHMKQTGFDAEIVISVQPTCPFLLPEDINQGIRLFLEHSFDSVASVFEIIHGHPYRAKTIRDNGLDPLFPEIQGDRYLQRQDLPKTYAYSGALYIRSADILMSWSGTDFGLGHRVGAVVIPADRAVNIDYEIDFTIAEVLMSQNAR